MRLAQCFGEKDTGVDLVLGDACQLGAERRELWVNLGSHISLELAHNCLLTDVDEHDGELNDLLLVERVILVVCASALEIIYTNVVNRCLMQEFLGLPVHDRSEVLGRDASIFEALRQNNSIL